MAIRNILKNGDDILRKKSREVTVFDNRLYQLLDDLADTMREANGVGLAAVQVGILRRVAVVDIGEGLIELINPVITERSEETISKDEGCLSFPGEYDIVERPKRVTVQTQDRHGHLVAITGEDVLARAFCHEIDHMDGIVFKDLVRLTPAVDR